MVTEGGGGSEPQRWNIDRRDGIKMDRWRWLNGRRERRQDGCERWRDGEISTIISDYQRESWCVFVLCWQTVAHVSFPVQEIMKLSDTHTHTHTHTHTLLTSWKYQHKHKILNVWIRMRLPYKPMSGSSKVVFLKSKISCSSLLQLLLRWKTT